MIMTQLVRISRSHIGDTDKVMAMYTHPAHPDFHASLPCPFLFKLLLSLLPLYLTAVVGSIRPPLKESLAWQAGGTSSARAEPCPQKATQCKLCNPGFQDPEICFTQID